MTRALTSLPIAITDLETTGTNPTEHEILEIGLLLVDQDSLEVLDKLDLRTKPIHIETATQDALAINGYNARDWANATALKSALQQYMLKCDGAIFCSHNVTFDWGFLNKSLQETGIRSTLDYHRLDLFTMAWTVLRGSDLKDFNLSKVAAYLGIGAEPYPHRAITGAEYAREVLKRLTVTMSSSSGVR